MPKFIGIPGIPDDYLREIGCIAVYWNSLEYLLNRTLAAAMNGKSDSDERNLLCFVHMAFPHKLDTLGALLRITNDDLGKVYRDHVIGKLRAAQKQRNIALHNSWFSEGDIVKRFSIDARGLLEYTEVPVSIEQLRQSSSLIVEAQAALFCWVAGPLTFKHWPQEGQKLKGCLTNVPWEE